jgi:hypothetical protein
METPEEIAAREAREKAEAEAKAEALASKGKKLPEGLLDATKQTILDSNGTLAGYKEAIDRSTKQTEKDALKKSMDRYLKVVNGLTEADIKIEVHNKKTNTYVVNAGNFGVRKVIMK